MATASYDGQAIFGQAIRVAVHDNPSAAQISAWFGVNGLVRLHGGGRGRLFEVAGVLVAPDPGTLAELEALIRSYDDGIGRVLVDTKGVSWPMVVFHLYRPEGRWMAAVGGYAQPYKAVFEGLI